MENKDNLLIMLRKRIPIREIMSKYNYSLSYVLKTIREGHELQKQSLLIECYEYLRRYVSDVNILDDMLSYLGTDLVVEAIEHSSKRLDGLR